MTDEISTERLSLRRFEAGDAARVTACINDPRIYLMVGRIKAGQNEAQTMEWIASHPLGAAGDTDHVRAVIADGELVGAVGGHRRNISDPFETGYWMAPDAWGQGYATEATGALLGWLEETRDVRVTVSGHYEDNPASGRVLQKLGYLYAGRSSSFCEGRAEIVERRDMARIA